MKSLRLDIVLLLLLACSLIGNVVLTQRWRAASQRLPAGVTPRPALSPGAKAPPFSAHRMDGTEITLDLKGAGKPTVLVLFSPGCSWCVRNWDNVRKLVADTNDRFSFVGVSLSSAIPDPAVTALQLPFPVYVRVTPETVENYGLGPTPETIVVSAEGEVLQNWLGAYTGDTKQAVESYFETRLPGLAPESSPPQRKLCRDAQGRTYSEGFGLTADGIKKRCRDGEWVPAAR